jgi:amino acid transporter
MLGAMNVRAGNPDSPAGSSAITVTSATAIGVGGMMGAGLYTLVGLAATTAGVWVPVAFLVGGVVAVFSVYSYAKLGARYPSRGGAAQFLIRCFGDGVIAGGLNIFSIPGLDHRYGVVRQRVCWLCPRAAALAHPRLVG